jgi:2-keto-4-pentenoate hydratase/2-oxohepta-3-ene-1,7-dioic acid hydratase in catechol pathway
VKFVHFVDAKHPSGVYGLVGDDGNLEILASGLLDPVVRTGEVILEREIRRYLPPLVPPNILAIGLNYRPHAAEGGEKPPDRPLMFIKATNALSAHRENIVLQKAAPEKTDYEAELCIVLGKTAKCVSVEQAPDYIFGYACGNDVSARDCQMGDGQWARGKSFDTFAPFGPSVVTGIDPGDLRIQLRLNGQIMQDDRTSNMIFSPALLVSYLSQTMTLLPGTVIFSGTPGGIGAARKPPVFLRPGDLCEVEIEKLGVLQNPVVAE